MNFRQGWLSLVVLSACAGLIPNCSPITQGLFGERTTPADLGDTTPPLVRMLIPAEAYIVDRPDNYFVSSTDPLPQCPTPFLDQRFTLSAVTEDDGGVRLSGFADAEFFPFCQPPSPAGARVIAGPMVVIPGTELRDTATGTAADPPTNRITSTQTFSFDFTRDRHCPSGHWLRGGYLYVRARGENFAGLTAETPETMFVLGGRRSLPAPRNPCPVSPAGTGGAPPSSGSGGGGTGGSGTGGADPCPREGDPCNEGSSPHCSDQSFRAPGTYQCVRGEEQCIASTENFCMSCGAPGCGECMGSSCTTDADCTPNTHCGSRSKGDPWDQVNRCVQDCLGLSGHCWMPGDRTPACQSRPSP